MSNYKSFITIFLLASSLGSGKAQSVKEYFTQEGLSLNSYYDLNLSDGYNTSFTYSGEEELCDLSISIFYHNHLNYKYYYYFVGERVYSINIDDCETKLVYDFALEVGETLSEGLYNGFTLTAKYPVTLLNGEERMRYDFGTSTSWIEGIGDIKYGTCEKLSSNEGRSKFICAKLGDELLWSNEDEIDKCADYSCIYPKVDFEVEIEDFNTSFSNTTLFGESYEWDFGDGTFSTDANPTHIYDKPGCYNVRLNGYSECTDKHRELTKKVPICSNDAWDEQFFNDSMQLLGVYKYSENIEFIFQHNMLFKTSDAGDTWVELSLPATPVSVNRNIFQIQFFNKFDGIIICSYSTIHEDLKSILVTQDGGISWEGKVGNDVFKHLAIGSNGEAWVSPFYHNNYLYRTLDYGQAWEKVELEESYHIREFDQVDENTIIGLGQFDDGQPKFRKAISLDKGANWDFIAFDHGIYGGKYFDENNAYTTHNGKFYITQNGGLDWTVKEIGLDLKSIHFNSPSHGWVIDVHNTVYYTTDSLITFYATNCATGDFRRFYVFNDTLAYGTIFDDPNWPYQSSLKVDFNKNKIGGCFSIIDNDEDGYTADEDCDDNNPEVNPGMEEIPNNMIDDNCNGEIDEMINGTIQTGTIKITTFPNPTSNTLSIEVEGQSFWQNVLLSMDGKEVASSNASQELILSDLPRGIYFLKILDGQQNLLGVEKVILQ